MTKIGPKITAPAQTEEAGTEFDFIALEYAITDVEGVRDILRAINNEEAVADLTPRSMYFLWKNLDVAVDEMNRQLRAYCAAVRAAKPAQASMPAGE